jgi:hypothetical protein
MAGPGEVAEHEARHERGPARWRALGYCAAEVERLPAEAFPLLALGIVGGLEKATRDLPGTRG